MHTRLTAIIATARLALTGHAAPPDDPQPHTSLPTTATQRGQEARVRVRTPSLTTEPCPWGAEELPDTSRRLLDVLRRLALDVLVIQGRERATIATFHLPAELLAAFLRVSRPTLYAHLRILAGRGLVGHTAHRTTSQGMTRCSGTVWAVAMRPGQEARVRWYDLRHDWRNLDADRAAGRTAWRLLQSEKTSERGINYPQIRAWALGESLTPSPVEDDCKAAQEVIWELADLPGLHRTRRLQAITSAAHTLAAGMRDPQSVRFYGAVITRALDAEVSVPGTLSRLVYALQRALVDAREAQALRRPGALLVSRLRSSGVWDVLAFA